MTSPYLTLAAQRAALPISVQYEDALCEFWIWPVDDDPLDEAAGDFIFYTPAEATRAYFDLVSKLDPGKDTSPPATCDRGSRTSSPWGTI